MNSPVSSDLNWALPFVGIPFASFGREGDRLDCWGLVRRVYREVKGVTLPAFEGEYASRLQRTCEVSALVHEQGWTEVASPEELCACVCRSGGRTFGHVGLYTGQGGGLMLHAVRPQSVLTPLRRLEELGYSDVHYFILT